MGRIDLPSGGWAEIRDPKALTERQRRPLRLLTAKLAQQVAATGFVVDPSAPKAVNEERAAGAISPEIALDIEIAAIGAFVSAWSFDTPPSGDAALDLPTEDYDSINEAVTPLINQVMLNTNPTPDPASPTGPSSASGPLSEGNLSLISAPNGVSTSSSS